MNAMECVYTAWEFPSFSMSLPWKKRPKRIGIDVDCVVIQTDHLWLDWLVETTGKKVEYLPNDYDFTKEFSRELRLLGMDGFEFWRDEGLYDHLSPHPDCIQTIRRWKKRGHEIVFISSIKGAHHKSKVEFLKRNFEFDAFIATKEKGYVDVDVMIDDRQENLDMFPNKVKKFLFLCSHNCGDVYCLSLNREFSEWNHRKIWKWLKNNI